MEDKDQLGRRNFLAIATGAIGALIGIVIAIPAVAYVVGPALKRKTSENSEKRRRERWVYNQRLRRNIRHVYWDSATLLSEDLKTSGPLHIIPGFKKTFPIKLNIPVGGRETLDSIDANVSWFIKGVVGVDDRPDPTSETIELQVFRAATTVIKEEVEMVPCEYCKALMPANSSSCPICGAPRKS